MMRNIASAKPTTSGGAMRPLSATANDQQNLRLLASGHKSPSEIRPSLTQARMNIGSWKKKCHQNNKVHVLCMWGPTLACIYICNAPAPLSKLKKNLQVAGKISQ